MNEDPGLPISHWRRSWLYAFSAMVLIVLIAPSVIIVIMSFSGSALLQFPPTTWSLRWYESYFDSREWREATMVSLRVAFLTTMIATPVGTAAAYAINAEAMRFKGAVSTLLTAVLIIPVILTAIGTFFLFARLGLNSTITGLVIAHTVLALPLVVITVVAGLRSYDMNQERVARSLGASHFSAFCQVTLPQIRFSIISGALFAFITSFDEVVVSLFISGGATTTLTRRMFNALRDQIDPTIAAISTLLIVLSILLLSIGQMFGRRS